MKFLPISKTKAKKIALTVGKHAALVGLGLCGIALIMFFYYTWDLPRPENFTDLPFVQSTKIYDRTGKVLLYDIYGEEKREVVPFDKISENIKKAIITSEDARFYQHNGVDLKALARSFLVDVRLRAARQGASTITQQLIRSVYLNRDKTISRKVREIQKTKFLSGISTRFPLAKIPMA